MHKVLVADDSTTIQKVIKMTLDQGAYDVYFASSEDELLDMVDASYDLLLFDYTLSPNYKGEELAKNIFSKVPSLKMVTLLSTFDNADIQALHEFGVVDTITKPFDSQAFISLVDKLVNMTNENNSGEVAENDEVASDLSEEHSESVDDNNPAEVEEQEIVAENENKNEDDEADDDEHIDGWEISHDEVEIAQPEEQAVSELDTHPAENNLTKGNDLEVVLNDWGIEVPASLEQPERVFAEVPPVVGEPKIVPQEEAECLPVEEDLEYPVPEEFADLNLSSRPISLDELNETEASTTTVVEDEETDPNITISDFQGNLEELVSDEVEDELWSVDEGLKVENISPRNLEELDDDEDDYDPTQENSEISTELQQDENPEIVDELIDAAVDETMQTALNSFNRDEFIAEIKDELKKDLITNPEFINSVKQELLAELLADNAFKQQAQVEIHKVAWEVIPDLAENLIQAEIKRIADSL